MPRPGFLSLLTTSARHIALLALLAFASTAAAMAQSFVEYGPWERRDFPANITGGFAVDSSGAVVTSAARKYYRSTDDGDHWEAHTATHISSSFRPLVVARDGRVIAPGDHEAYATTDGGVTWTTGASYGARWVKSTAAIVLPDGDVLVGTSNVGLLRSSDAGATWRFEGMANSDANDIAVSASDIWFIGTGVGLRRTAPGGSGWLPTLGFSASVVSAIVTSPTMTTLVGGTENQGIWYSMDSGYIWTRGRFADGSGGLMFDSIYDIVILPDGSVIATTDDNGAIRSYDRGRTWVRWSEGIVFDSTGRPQLDQLVVTPNGRVIASAFGEQYVRDPLVSSTKLPAADRNGATLSHGGDAGEIILELPAVRRGDAIVHLIDVAGAIRAVVRIAPDVERATIPTTALASGLYLMRIQSEGGVETLRVMIRR